MKKVFKMTTLLLFALILAFSFPACNNVKHKYIFSGTNYIEPSFSSAGSPQQGILFDLEYGEFYINTTDIHLGDTIVDSHLNLLNFLKNNGLNIRQLKYLVSDYQCSFGDSKYNTVYLDINSPNDYKTIIAYLQAIWGEYTNYGYLYALSDAIAEKLGWMTDDVVNMTQSDINAFFKSNADMLNLDYLRMTTTYSTAEEVKFCKALSKQLLEKIDWQSLLSLNIDEQLRVFYQLIDDYARQINTDFTRSDYRFAYYGSNIPLKIMLTNVELQLENGYVDSATGNADFWKDCRTIISTTTTIDNEVNASLKKFGLYDTAELVTIKLYSAETAQKVCGSRIYNAYFDDSKTVCATTLMGYLHEYYHFIEHRLNPMLGTSWQSQAFCELGRAYSYFSQQIISSVFEDQRWSELFKQYFGHEYQGTMDDYFLVYDMYCYTAGEYILDYNSGRNPINSFTYYLLKTYGEDNAIDMLLFPEKTTLLTGKNWGALYDDWYTQLCDRFENFYIPDWIYEMMKLP